MEPKNSGKGEGLNEAGGACAIVPWFPIKMEITHDIVVNCPHCNQPILIEKLNCRIFRHGTLISNGEQMNPHESKENCDSLVKRNLIYGCGKPFKIIDNEDGALVAVVCEYI